MQKRLLYLAVLCFAFLSPHLHPLHAGYLDLVASWDVNYFHGISGDGKTLLGGYDCGPDADCDIRPVLFDNNQHTVREIPFWTVVDLSTDASHIVGVRREGPVLWNQGDDDYVVLDPQPRRNSSDAAYGVTADGLVVVGKTRGSAFRWTEEEGIQRIEGLARFSTAVGVSDDGTYIAGESHGSRGPSRAFRWSNAGIEELPIIEPFDSSRATAISADGKTVIGQNWHTEVVIGQPNGTGFLWHEERGLTDLGPIVPTKVNGDGTVVLAERGVWTNDQFHSFEDFILDATGERVENVWLSGVADDGRTLVGVSYGDIGFTSGVIVRLGEFRDCDLNGDGACNDIDIDAMSHIPHHGYRYAYDLDGNETIDFEDRRIWVEERMSTYFGDVNLDGEFTSADLTAMFQLALYESPQIGGGSWQAGDFNGDHLVNSSDLVLAFQSNSYEQGPRSNPVPEPSHTFILAMLVGTVADGWRRRRQTS